MRFPRFFSGTISVFLVFVITFQFVLFPISVHRAEAGATDAILKDFLGSAATGIISCAATYGISAAMNAIFGLSTAVPATDGSGIAKFINQNCLKPIAKQIALGVLKKLTESTVNWINGGFNGNPFYVRDLGSYLVSITDASVKEIAFKIKIQEGPYSVAISTGLINSYLVGQQKTPPIYSLDKIVGEKAEAFREGDFKAGGWDAWLATTILPQNNPVGSAFLASDMASKELSKKVEENKQDLSQNDGFLSMKKCLEKTETEDGEVCSKYETATPGSLISEQLGSVSNTSKDQILSTEDLMESLMTVFSALTTKLITDGVSSLSSGGNGVPSEYGGYGSNNLNVSTAPSGSLPGWATAGGYDQGLIDLDNLADYEEIQQEIVDKTADLNNKLRNLIDKLNEADYCVPGPNPMWYEHAKTALGELLSGWVPDTKGGVVTFIQSVFGVTVAEPSADDGHAPQIRTLTTRGLDGGNNKNSGTYERGYKDFIEEAYSGINNIPIAETIFKEVKEIETYQAIISYNQDRSDKALGFLGSLNYIKGEYNQLPPITDPTYLEERKSLQTVADSILVGIYPRSSIAGIDNQISDADIKTTFIAEPTKGLIDICKDQLVSYSTTPNGPLLIQRRPFPIGVLPAGVEAQYPAVSPSSTFLPDVSVGPDAYPPPGATSGWDWILIDDFYNPTGPAENPATFENTLGVY